MRYLHISGIFGLLVALILLLIIIILIPVFLAAIVLVFIVASILSIPFIIAGKLRRKTSHERKPEPKGRVIDAEYRELR